VFLIVRAVNPIGHGAVIRVFQGKICQRSGQEWKPPLHWITRYGYAGIFALRALGIVGLPIPDETLLIFVGYSIYRGRLHPVPAVLSAFAGTACGISLSYALGRGFGKFIVPHLRYFLHLGSDRLNRVHDWFRRAGRWALVLGYYVPGVRHLTAYAAGTSGLRFLDFAVFAYAGGLFWSITFVGLGYLLGEKWRRGEVLHSLRIFGGIAAVATLVYVLPRLFKGAHRSSFL